MSPGNTMYVKYMLYVTTYYQYWCFIVTFYMKNIYCPGTLPGTY